jgi:hypothetical protein
MVQQQQMRCNGCKHLLQFGLRLVGHFQTFDQMWLCRQGWSTRSWFHSKTSLIGNIPRPWNDSAALDEVQWLQTSASFWSQIGWTFPNFCLDLAQKQTWLGRNAGPPEAVFTAKHHSLATYTKAMEWFSSTRRSAIPANICFSLGSDWLDISKLF